MSFGASLVVCGVLCIPGLLWLRRRRAHRLTALRRLSLCVPLNLPPFAFLIYRTLAGGFFTDGGSPVLRWSLCDLRSGLWKGICPALRPQNQNGSEYRRSPA